MLKRSESDFTVNGPAFENIRATSITTAFDIDTGEWLLAGRRASQRTDSVKDTLDFGIDRADALRRVQYPPGRSPHRQRPLQRRQAGTNNSNMLTTDFSYDGAGNVVGRR